MMTGEVAAGVGLLLYCTLIGLPLAWLAASASPALEPAKRAFVLCAAPGMGVAVLCLITTALFMYVGPSESWGLVSAIVMGALAIAGIALLTIKRRWRARRSLVLSLAISGGLGAVVLGAFAIPAMTMGPEGVVYRSNPSDSFMYFSLAESTRTSSYEQIVSGKGLSESPETTALLQESPAALYSARMVGRSMRLGTFVQVGWFSQLANSGVEHLLWIFAGVCAAAMSIGLYGAARLAGANQLLAVLAALAAGLGYWSATVADADAISGMHILPVVTALAILKILEQHQLSMLSSAPESSVDAPEKELWIPTTSAVLAGVLLAGATVIYTEMAPFVLLALMTATAVWAVHSRSIARPVVDLAVCVLVALIVLLLGNQLLYLGGIFITQLLYAMGAASIGGYATDFWLHQNIGSALAGLAWLDQPLISIGVPPSVAGATEWILSITTIGVASVVGILTLFAAGRQLTFVAALVAISVLASVYGFVFRQDPYWVLKGMPLAAPFIMLLLAAMPTVLQRFLPSSERFKPIAIGVSAVLLATTVSFAAPRLVDDLSGVSPAYTSKIHEKHDYDLSQVEERLSKLCPCELVINVPPTADWWWSHYVTKRLQRFRPFQQMGVYYDNGPRVLAFPDLNVKASPKYAVVIVEADYLAPEQLGRLLVEQSGVRLYEITSSAKAAFGPRPPPEEPPT